MPTPPRAAVSLVAQTRPAPPEVLDPDDQVGVEQLQARLDQPLLLIGVAHLDTGALGRLGVVVAPSEAGRGQHADAADPVPPGGRSEQDGQVPHPGGGPEDQSLGREHPHAQHVDQRVLGVAVVEGELTADGGHPHRVPVARDAGHHALDQPLLAGVAGVAEEQGVHDGDGTGPHGEDVPQDPPDPGGRPLVGLDGRGVVVALDADGHGDTVPGVDDPGVLARAHQHMGRLGGQPPQMDPGRLVRAVLAPHDGEERQLQMVGRTTEDGLHLVPLAVGEAEGPVQWLTGCRIRLHCHVPLLSRSSVGLRPASRADRPLATAVAVSVPGGARRSCPVTGPSRTDPGAAGPIAARCAKRRPITSDDRGPSTGPERDPHGVKARAHGGHARSTLHDHRRRLRPQENRGCPRALEVILGGTRSGSAEIFTH